MAEPAGKRFVEWLRQPGVLAAVPVTLFLVIGFAGPLILVWWYSLMPPKTFTLAQAPTLDNFISSAAGSYYISFGWSLYLSAITVLILEFTSSIKLIPVVASSTFALVRA